MNDGWTMGVVSATPPHKCECPEGHVPAIELLIFFGFIAFLYMVLR
jgi:hypothetical protein